MAVLLWFIFAGRIDADNIAFLYAIDEDLNAFAREASVLRAPIKLGSETVKVYSAGRHTVYALRMGRGPVVTAANASTLFSRFHIDGAISIGPVGALASSDGLRPHSWVRIDKVFPYQRGTFTPEGFFPRADDLPTPPKLAPEYLSEHLPELWKSIPKVACASGEAFVSSDSARQEIHELTRAEVIDMNLYGLYTVLEHFQIPSLDLRVVSDTAGNDAAAEFSRFLGTYKGEGGTLLAEFIAALPPSPNSLDSYENLKKLVDPE